jgi:hypothetical protein
MVIAAHRASVDTLNCGGDSTLGEIAAAPVNVNVPECPPDDRCFIPPPSDDRNVAISPVHIQFNALLYGGFNNDENLFTALYGTCVLWLSMVPVESK